MLFRAFSLMIWSVLANISRKIIISISFALLEDILTLQPHCFLQYKYILIFIELNFVLCRGPPVVFILHLGVISRERLSGLELVKEYLKHRQEEEVRIFEY